MPAELLYDQGISQPAVTTIASGGRSPGGLFIMTATATPDAATTTLSSESLQKLEALATQTGWTLDKTVNIAAGLLGFVLDADSGHPAPKVYTYRRNGDRYSFQINR